VGNDREGGGQKRERVGGRDGGKREVDGEGGREKRGR
jgi:hypothetical protein